MEHPVAVHFDENPIVLPPEPNVTVRFLFTFPWRKETIIISLVPNKRLSIYFDIQLCWIIKKIIAFGTRHTITNLSGTLNSSSAHLL